MRITTEQRIAAFCIEQWGFKNHARICQKLAEEVGEVAGATLKIEDGRATREDLQSEIGDVLIVLSQLAAMEGTTLERMRADTFKRIKKRAAEKAALKPPEHINARCVISASLDERVKRHRRRPFARR